MKAKLYLMPAMSRDEIGSVMREAKEAGYHNLERIVVDGMIVAILS